MRSGVLLVALAACGRTGFDPHDARVDVDGSPDVRVPRAPLVWQQQTSNTTNRLFDVWGTSADNIYAVGDGGTIDHWNGATWMVETTPDTTSIYGISGSSAGDIRAVGNASASGGMAIWRPDTSVAGNWLNEQNTITHVLNSALVISATNMYAVGYTGTLLHSTADGTWTPENPGTTVNLESLWASGPNDIYAVGYSGTILHSTGDGTWTPQSTGTAVPLIGIYGTGPQDIWVCGHSGKMLHSRGDGVWTVEDTGVGFDLFGIFVIGDFAIASGFGNVIITKDGAGPWTQQTLPVSQPFFDTAWGASPDDLVIVGEGGTILRGTR